MKHKKTFEGVRRGREMKLEHYQKARSIRRALPTERVSKWVYRRATMDFLSVVAGEALPFSYVAWYGVGPVHRRAPSAVSSPSLPAPKALMQRYGDLLRFVLVGASNTALGYLMFAGFLWVLGDGPGRAGLAQLFAYCVGTLWSFYWNRRWTFRSSGKVKSEGIRFVGLQAVLALTSSGAIAFLSAQLTISVHIIWVLVTAVITAVNFVVSKYVVFRGGRLRHEQQPTAD